MKKIVLNKEFYTKKEVLDILDQILELAAENAKITAKLKENCNELSMLDEWTTYIVDKQSILNTINQIE